MSSIVRMVSKTSIHRLPFSYVCRGFQCSVPQPNKSAIQQRWNRRTERYLKKTADLLAGKGSKSGKKKTGYFYNALFPHESSSLPGTGSEAKVNPGHDRRIRQLSVVLNDYITSLISSGEVCPQLIELGFEIVKVQVVADMSVINVSWAATGSAKDNLISELLPGCASQLRSSLTDLRIMGHLPPIQFVKDLTACRLNEVEELLKVADMGPDFESTPLGDHMKTPPTLLSRDRLPKQSIVETMQNVETIPGPGGSFEVRARPCTEPVEGDLDSWTHWNSAQDSQTPDDDKSIYNSEEHNESENVDRLQNSDTGESVSRSAANRVKKVVKAEDIAHKTNPPIWASDLPLESIVKSDVYGLDRDNLWQQVLQTKRKSQDRSYKQRAQGEVHQPTVSVSDISSHVRELIAKQRKKKGRLIRNMDQLLSSQFHQVDQ